MDNPYPQDHTIQKVFALFSAFVDLALEEVRSAQDKIQMTQQRLDLAHVSVKNFESNVGRHLSLAVKALPVSICPFCGGTVVDKSPLKDFIGKIDPRFEDGSQQWKDFWEETREQLRLCPECITCGVYQNSDESHNSGSGKTWLRTSNRKPRLVDCIFDKYLFVETVSKQNNQSTWMLIIEGGEIWRFDGTEDEVRKKLNLPHIAKLSRESTSDSSLPETQSGQPT